MIMCGIAGILGISSDIGLESVNKMLDGIAHRGPDHAGVWIDSGDKVAVGHRRLSIVDLSPSGNQPMLCHSGRYVIVFNGEIYNHHKLRKELAGNQSMDPWRGTSDTETLLEAIDRWGIRGALERSIGMFAFAVWDRQLKRLTLARDRIGEKPLYFGLKSYGSERILVFSSELGAFRESPVFVPEIDREALALYTRFGYVPSPLSIFKGIGKVLPGQIITFDAQLSQIADERYWTISEVVQGGISDPYRGTESSAIDELKRRLRTTISAQANADVPVGAFLSGGIDSSTVVAILQEQASRAVKTFTIGFSESEYNEAGFAKKVAEHLRTEHHQLYLGPQDLISAIPMMPQIYSEPFADSSQIPSYLVSALARSSVKVVLSGDGGDELFGGYNRYIYGKRLHQVSQIVPLGLKGLFINAVRSIPLKVWDSLSSSSMTNILGLGTYRELGDKIHKVLSLLEASSSMETYNKLISAWEPEKVVVGANDLRKVATNMISPFDGIDPILQMMAIDTTTFLPDDILVKMDRASMAVSLEGRMPFLDHQIVEFAWRLPLQMKIRQGASKWILRKLLDQYVPRNLTERPKMGFSIPLSKWLRGPLREWAEAQLSWERLKGEGYFEPKAIRGIWEEHVSGRRNWQARIWIILMFQSWLDRQRLK